jgi:hypothetical protein
LQKFKRKEASSAAAKKRIGFLSVLSISFTSLWESCALFRRDALSSLTRVVTGRRSGQSTKNEDVIQRKDKYLNSLDWKGNGNKPQWQKQGVKKAIKKQN